VAKTVAKALVEKANPMRGGISGENDGLVGL
jgi:hypothetical protein